MGNHHNSLPELRTCALDKPQHLGAGLAVSEAYFETFRNDCMKRYMKMAEIMTQQKSNTRLSVIALSVHANVRIRIAGTIALNPSGMHEHDSLNESTLLTA